MFSLIVAPSGLRCFRHLNLGLVYCACAEDVSATHHTKFFFRITHLLKKIQQVEQYASRAASSMRAASPSDRLPSRLRLQKLNIFAPTTNLLMMTNQCVACVDRWVIRELKTAHLPTHAMSAKNGMTKSD